MPFSMYYVCMCVYISMCLYIYRLCAAHCFILICLYWDMIPGFQSVPMRGSKKISSAVQGAAEGNTPVIQWSFSWSVFFSTWIWSKLWLESWSKLGWWKTTSGTTRVLLLNVKSLHWRSVEGEKRLRRQSPHWKL